MKKLDKLILKYFFGPFILTFLVAVFILLIQYMLKYFDDFIGKNLGIGVFGELMMYFSINMVPMALPLAVLISSLMTYGKLGEHFELTAIKSAGISLIRVLIPTFVFVVALSIGAFFFNNHVVPYANLRAYSLLYDIKQTKPALDLKEGQFYNGLPDYSIKVKIKHPDGVAMNDVVIYDHSNSNGNRKVIVADSCRMYTFINDRYLMMELFDGNYYIEEDDKKKKKKIKRGEVHINRFVRTEFDKMDIVFSLSSFDLDRTDMDLFAGNRYMKSVKKLGESIDSMKMEKKKAHFKLYPTLASAYKLHQAGYIHPTEELRQLNFPEDTSAINDIQPELQDSVILLNTPKNDSIEKKPNSQKDKGTGIVQKRPVKNRTSGKNTIGKMAKKSSVTSGMMSNQNSSQFNQTDANKYIGIKRTNKEKQDSLYINIEAYQEFNHFFDSMYQIDVVYMEAITKATSNARSVKANITSTLGRFKYYQRSIDSHTVEKYKKYAQAFSCIVMFLIGAPLGAIIKRGGLGLPVIIGIFFFVIFYVLTSVSDKSAKSGLVDGLYAAWLANAVLLGPGIFFLKQARKDAKVFDADFYNVLFDKLKVWWSKRTKGN